MNISKLALTKIKTNKVIGALIIATDKSYPTIKRWIDTENDKITDSRICMNLISELTGLSEDEIIESPIKYKSVANN